MIGKEIRARDRLGRVTEWKVADRFDNGYYLLIAINRTAAEYKRDLEYFKKTNPRISSVQALTLEEFISMEVEPAWFEQRKITVIGGAA